jgi:hypothetical protein
MTGTRRRGPRHQRSLGGGTCCEAIMVCGGARLVVFMMFVCVGEVGDDRNENEKKTLDPEVTP